MEDKCKTHNVSKVDLGKSERFERRVGEPDGLLDVLFEELLHVHPKERPGLPQHLNTQSKTKHVKDALIPRLNPTVDIISLAL